MTSNKTIVIFDEKWIYYSFSLSKIADKLDQNTIQDTLSSKSSHSPCWINMRWECTIDYHLQGYVVACETAFYLVMHQFKNEERDGSKWALKSDDEIRYLPEENNVFRSRTHLDPHNLSAV